MLLAVAFAIATWVAFAIPTPTTSADDHGDRDRDRKHQDITPRITVESSVVEECECLVTTQKEVEGPIVVSEEIFEPLRDPDTGNFFDRETGEPTIEPGPDGEPLPEDRERILHVPTGEFRDVIREIEIIKVISGCADDITDPETDETFLGVRPHVSTLIVQCHKELDFGHANCQTRRGHFGE